MKPVSGASSAEEDGGALFGGWDCVCGPRLAEGLRVKYHVKATVNRTAVASVNAIRIWICRRCGCCQRRRSLARSPACCVPLGNRL